MFCNTDWDVCAGLGKRPNWTITSAQEIHRRTKNKVEPWRAHTFEVHLVWDVQVRGMSKTCVHISGAPKLKDGDVLICVRRQRGCVSTVAWKGNATKVCWLQQRRVLDNDISAKQAGVILRRNRYLRQHTRKSAWRLEGTAACTTA